MRTILGLDEPMPVEGKFVDVALFGTSSEGVIVREWKHGDYVSQLHAGNRRHNANQHLRTFIGFPFYPLLG